jgi:hypothetical protein
MTIVALCAGLLVVGAIVGAIVRDDRTHLAPAEFTGMARSIGALGGDDSMVGRCGHLPADADPRRTDLDEDCRVSKRMADLLDAIDACHDSACVQPLAAVLVADAQRAQEIEHRFSVDLTGACRRFLELEAAYDAAIADATDPLVTLLPADDAFMDGLGRWREATDAAARAVNREPVLLLLDACDPTA